MLHKGHKICGVHEEEGLSFWGVYWEKSTIFWFVCTNVSVIHMFNTQTFTIVYRAVNTYIIWLTWLLTPHSNGKQLRSKFYWFNDCTTSLNWLSLSLAYQLCDQCDLIFLYNKVNLIKEIFIVQCELQTNLYYRTAFLYIWITCSCFFF